MLGQLLPYRFLRTAVLGRRAFFPPTLLTSNLSGHCPGDVGLRPFSTRSHRPRGGGGGYDGGRGSLDSYGSRTLRRGEFQTGSLSGRGGGGPKSLIEDEAELSDWVGGINTSSLSLGLSSESDEDSGRESGMGRGRGRRGGRDGVSSSRRSRNDDFDDYGRSSRGLPSKRSGRLYSNNDDDVDDEDEVFSSRKRPTGLRSREELSSRGERYGGSKLSRVRDDGDSMRGRKAPGKRARRIMGSEDDEDDMGDLSGLGESEEEQSDSDIELFRGGAHKVESETIRRKELAPKSTSIGKNNSYLSETRFVESAFIR